jgi:hypothetical protein
MPKNYIVFEPGEEIAFPDHNNQWEEVTDLGQASRGARCFVRGMDTRKATPKVYTLVCPFCALGHEFSIDPADDEPYLV